MKVNKKISLLLSCTLYFVLCALKSHSQDLHFSQYTNSPLLVNPANTGFSPDYDFRVGLNYRNQWAATNVPYKTFSAWGDAKLFNRKLENSWVGVGAILLNDVAGTGTLTSVKSFLNLAYHQQLNDNNLLSIGFSGGMVQKRIDYTKLTFDQQWNNRFFDIDLPSNEPFVTNNASYLDLNAGINYSWFASDNFYFNVGASVMHLNTPSETFFNPATVDARLSRRYNYFINASIKASDALILNPHIYYSKMSTSNETVIGLVGQYNLGDYGGSNQLLFGVYYRNKDAIAPTIGYMINNTQLMFNYDATTSSLTNYNSFRNAYEFSIVWNGIYNGLGGGEKAMKCPRF
ncbi:MAG: PorP/SprF family type IX secretion system membrane protein [Chitinophagaceae bacterium]